jgi:hypothetical protein
MRLNPSAASAVRGRSLKQPVPPDQRILPMATREVEVFRCWDDKTWDTDVVTIEDPGDDQDEEVEKRCVSILKN